MYCSPAYSCSSSSSVKSSLVLQKTRFIHFRVGPYTKLYSSKSGYRNKKWALVPLVATSYLGNGKN